MGASLQPGGRARGGIVGINVTPLVDVVLVLLVIMMVSATYIVSRNLKVDLPKTASSDEPAASPAMVTVSPDGALHFNQRPVTDADLARALREAVARDREVTLVVSADHRATHGRVVHVMDVAKVAGITRFAISVEREAGASP
jgi:biopolymer transport protein ExbD